MINARQVISPLFFLTGFGGVVYLIVCTWQLTAVWGGALRSVALAAGVFVFGAALGGAVIGRLGDRVKDRLGLFVVIESLAGAYAFLSPHGISLVEGLYYGGGYPHPALRFVLSGLVFLVPSILLGGCLPIVTAAVAPRRSDTAAGEIGCTAGRLYVAGLLGGAAGALASGFVLLEHLGARSSLFVVGGCHLAVAITVLLTRLAGRAKENPPDDAETGEAPRADSAPASTPRFAARILMAAAFVLSGAALLSHWLLWTRLFVQCFSNSIYSVAIVLFSFLLSLAGGGALGAAIARRGRNPQRFIAFFQLSGALASVAVLYLFHWVGDRERFSILVRDFGGDASFSALIVFEIICVFSVLLVPALLLGTALPLIVASGGWTRRSPGGHVGDRQALFAGGIAAGLIVTACSILPSGIGTAQSFFVAAGFSAAAAWLLLFARTAPATGSRRLKTWLAAAVLSGAAVVLALCVPRSFEFWKNSVFDKECVYFSDDGMAAVCVVQRADGRVLKVDNAEGLGGPRDELLEMRIGMFPGLLCDQPEKALCLGLGNGHSLMGLIGSGPRQVDCVDDLPGVIEAAHYFHNFPVEVPAETTLKFTASDIRVFLSSTDRTYDLILGNPGDPSRAGAGLLYTKEHFERIHDRLSDQGLFCQWIPLHQLHWEDFGIIGYTFSEVFDYMAVFLADTETPFPVAGLVGTRQPLRLDPRAMQKRLDLHPFRGLLKKIGLDNALENLSLYVNDQWLFRTRFPGQRVNTADRPLVEFHAARLMARPDVLGFKHFLQLSEPRLNEDVLPLLDSVRLEGQERRDFEIEIRSYSDGLRYYLACHAYELWEMILSPIEALNPTPEGAGELRRLFEKRFELSIEAFRLAPEHRVLCSNLVRLWKDLIQRNELVRAANLMATAAKERPEDPTMAFNWGLSYLLQEEYESAAIIFEKALGLNPKYSSARLHYGIALFCSGIRVRAREELDRALEDGGGMEQLSDLTRALATLILDGHEKAGPLLARFEKEGPWAALIERAVDQARGGDRPAPEPENENGD